MTIAVVAAVEGVLAWFTQGTPDITIWRSFADTVAAVGPIRIYGLDSAGLMVYNHPPLIGWWLTAVNASGLPFPFMIRLPSVLAHAATTLLVFSMLRRRTTPTIALRSALAVAVSPVLLVIAGYHGNNDPVMAALLLAAVWLLVDRRAPVWAGLAFALALSVKIVPVIVLPVLAVAAWRLGWRVLARFTAGAAPVFLLLWLPVLVLAGRGFLTHVIGYNGSGFPRQWGLYKIMEFVGLPGAVLEAYAGPGTYLVLAVAALLPAWLIRRWPGRAPAATGLSLCLFLLLSPGWAPQYTSWVAAAVFLVSYRAALAFTAVAGAVYLVLYTQWSGWRMWDWANVTTLTRPQIALAALVWLSLIPVVVAGIRSLARGPVATSASVVGGYTPAL